MIHELLSPVPINGSFDTLSFGKRPVGEVENHLSLLLRVRRARPFPLVSNLRGQLLARRPG